MGQNTNDEWLEDLPWHLRTKFKIKEILRKNVPRWIRTGVKARKRLVAVIVASAVLYAILVAWVPESVITPDVVIAWSSAHSAFISLLLTFSLVVLYFVQHRTQVKQSRIMDRQESWMEHSNRADLFIENWTADGDEINIALINAGNGTAKNIRVRLSFWWGEDAESAPFTEKSSYNVLGLDRLEDINSSILWSEEGPVKFGDEVSFGANIYDENGNQQARIDRGMFRDNMGELSSLGVSKIVIIFSLLYDDDRGKTPEWSFWGCEFKPVSGLSLKEAIEKGEEVPTGPPVVRPT